MKAYNVERAMECLSQVCKIQKICNVGNALTKTNELFIQERSVQKHQ